MVSFYKKEQTSNKYFKNFNSLQSTLNQVRNNFHNDLYNINPHDYEWGSFTSASEICQQLLKENSTIYTGKYRCIKNSNHPSNKSNQTIHNALLSSTEPYTCISEWANHNYNMTYHLLSQPPQGRRRLRILLLFFCKFYF